MYIKFGNWEFNKVTYMQLFFKLDVVYLIVGCDRPNRLLLIKAYTNAEGIQLNKHLWVTAAENRLR